MLEADVEYMEQLQLGHYKEAILQMEGLLLSGERLPLETYRQIPDPWLRKSPLLMKDYAGHLYRTGMFAEARKLYQLALKGFALQTSVSYVRSTMSMLAISSLRLGLHEEAETILRLLEEESMREGEDLPGHAYRALGLHAGLRGDRKSAKENYERAIAVHRARGEVEFEREVRQELQEIVESEEKKEATKWRFHCFGGLKASSTGKTVERFMWSRKKSHELFVYLLLRPRCAVSKEQMMEEVFADLSQEKVDNQLHVIIHDIRKTMKQACNIEKAVQVKDGLIRLNETLVEMVDIEQYTTLSRVGEQLWNTSTDLAGEMFEQACQMYDEVVPEISYADWLERHRTAIRERQSTMLRKLGQAFMMKGAPESAEYYFREWMRHSPLQEEAYQEMIRLLMSMNRHAEAHLLLKEWKRLCKEELGTEPMPETLLLVSR